MGTNPSLDGHQYRFPKPPRGASMRQLKTKERVAEMHGPIIASVDGSQGSTDAARVAAALARGLGRRLVLAHVADDPAVFPYGDRWLREAQRRRAMQRSN